MPYYLISGFHAQCQRTPESPLLVGGRSTKKVPISGLFLSLNLLSLSEFEISELPRFLEGLSGLYGLPKITKIILVAWNHTKILDIRELDQKCLIAYKLPSHSDGHVSHFKCPTPGLTLSGLWERPHLACQCRPPLSELWEHSAQNLLCVYRLSLTSGSKSKIYPDFRTTSES